MGRSCASCSVVDMPMSAVAEEARMRALERLYLRREAVEELIRSLECYEETSGRRAPCVSITSATTCS
jgi:hypothetical protein